MTHKPGHKEKEKKEPEITGTRTVLSKTENLKGLKKEERAREAGRTVRESFPIQQGRSLAPGIQAKGVKTQTETRPGFEQSTFETRFQREDPRENLDPRNLPTVPQFTALPQTQEELQALIASGRISPELEQTISEIIQDQENRRILAEQDAREQPGIEPGLVTEAAELGVVIPVAAANLISKGLSLLGVEIGEITTEEFASTSLGKALGIAGLGAAAIATGAALGYFAATLIPVGSAASAGTLTVAQVGRGTVGAVGVKTGLASTLASSKLIKTLFIGGAIVSLINGRLGDLETSIVNQRETITLYGSAVQVGAITPTEAILLFDELEQDINSTESAIHQTALVSIKAWLGKGKELETRIEKARTQLVVERGRLVQFVTPEPQGI